MSADGQPGPVLVLGAGIAGLGAALALADRGIPVTVIDAAAAIGGTHRSREIGAYTFDVGSIFYEDEALLFRSFPGTAALCPRVRRVQRRIAPEGKTLHYPMDPRDVLAWPKPRLAAAVLDLLVHRLTQRRDGTVDAACLRRLGRRIYEGTGLRDYIRRFHHVPPEALDEEFFYRRMSFLEKQTRPRAMFTALWRGLLRRPARRGPPAVLRVRPAAGFAALFAPIRQTLADKGVTFALGRDVTSIAREGEGFVVATSEGSFRGRAVIGAMPIDGLYRAAFGRASGLKSLDLMTLFVSAARLPAGFGNVLFNFHGQGRWKRATIYSRLYEGLGAGREFLAVEVTLPPGAAPDPEAAFADFAGHLAGIDAEVADLRLEGHELVASAYPLYLRGEAQAAAPIIAELAAFGILPVGRQGRFEYLPTSTGVLRRVGEEIAAAPLAAATPPARGAD